MNAQPRREDTAPIQAIQVSDMRGEFGLWRLQQASEPSGQLVMPMSRIAALTIGREPDNNLILDDITVSRHHCRIVLDESGVPGRGPWIVEDLGARNGTWVGLDRLPSGGKVTILAGQTLRIGAVLLWLGDGSAEDTGALSRCIPGFSSGRSRLIRRLDAMVKQAHPIVLVGPYGCGRRSTVACLIRAVSNRSRATRLSISDVNSWQRALATAESAVAPMVLTAGPVENFAPEVQAFFANMTERQAATIAAGRPPQWYFFGWAGPSVVPFAVTRDPVEPLLRRSLAGAWVDMERLDLHREDLPGIVERMRSNFDQPNLRELAAIDANHAAEVCAQVQRWVNQRWPAELAEVAAMALPNHEVEEVLSHGLPASSGTWTPQPLPVVARHANSDALLGSRRRLPESGGFGEGQADHTRVSDWTIDGVRSANWFAVALSDPVTLWQAIHTIFGGNIRAFCDEAGVAQSRNPESVRRQVYRHLGDRVRTLRQ